MTQTDPSNLTARHSAADRKRQTRRLGALALLGVACPLVIAACGSSDLVPVIDFVQRAPDGRLILHRAGYEFSADERRQGLLDRGWSAPEVRPTDDVTFAWAVGVDADVRLFLADRRSTWLHFRCWPATLATDERQSVTVRVNGAELGTLALEPSVRVYSLPVPLNVLAIGRNTVSFRFAQLAAANERTAGDDERALAAAFDYVALSPDPEAGPPRVPDGELQMVDHAFQQPVGSEIAFSTVIPLNGTLEYGVSGSAGGRRRYLEEVEYTDQHLGRLLGAMRDAGQLDDTLVMFTADHGEGLGDHGGVDGMGHVNQLYESQLRVPLIFSWPGHLPEGITIDAPVSLVDLLPTVLDLLNVPDQMNRSGRSLVPLLDAERSTAPPPIVAATFRPGAREDLEAVIVGEHKLILAERSGRIELYDLGQDPAENTNQAADQEDRVSDLRDLLEAEINAAITYEADDLELSEEDLQRLRALGYVR